MASEGRNTPGRQPEPVNDSRSLVDATRNVLLALIVAAMPFAILEPLAVFEERTISTYHRLVVVVMPLDIISIGLALLAIPLIVSALRRRDVTWGTLAMSAFALWGLISLIATPTTLGGSFVIRWFAAIALVVTVASRTRSELRWFVAAPLLASASLQTVVALWQHPGPGANTVFFAGEVAVGRGTFTHQYGLAFFLIVAATIGVATLPRGRTRIWWLAGIGMASAGIAVTMSRTALLALVGIWIVYAWGWFRGNRDYRSALLATSIPFLATATVVSDGWLSRLNHTASGSLEARSTGRIASMREAAAIATGRPLTGVGPGGFVTEIISRHPEWPIWFLLPVHSVPLLAAAELGIVAGVIIVVILVAFGWRSLRTSPAAFAIYVPVAAFILFEQRTHYVPADVALFAIWLGTLDLLARHASDTGSERTV